MTADEIPPSPGELLANPADPIIPGGGTPGAATRTSPPAWEDLDDGARPTGLVPEQIGFTPRRSVPWLSPVLLAGTAVRVVLAELFGAYLDKRELQNALPARVFDERPQHADGTVDETGGLWFDYVADLGDGFDPTYSIAYLLAQPSLAIDGQDLPRGQVLVMGGDQVYPTASGKQYEDRFKGPYRSALPRPPLAGPRPVMYALPGNHDWYDGLTAFLRLFTRAEDGHVGGWCTRQARSYFAIRLPHNWWLLGIDAQFGAYLDDPQLRYFRDAAAALRPGDRVIICPPSPGWVQTDADPHAYDTIDYFVRTVIAPTGAEVRLMISGDLHHYARYRGPDRDLITCGGGGAYLYATHVLPETIQVPPKTTLMRRATASQEYRLAATYPTKERSRLFAAGVFGRLPLRNPGFLTLLGTVHMLLMLALAGIARPAGGATERLVTIPAVLMAVIVLGSNMAFAMPPTAGHRRRRHWVLGTVHGLLHIALGILGALVWLRLPFADLPWPLPVAAAALIYLPIAGVVASQLVAAYLLAAGVFRVNVNELFASQGIADAKGFLRLHIDPGGTLTIYPVAVDRVCHEWAATPTARPDRPWFEPATPIRVHLAEDPIRLT